MRPLVLKIRGLRSYRRDVEIDFRDRNLAAIIGDTGAGKSSILEAICFALYGTATWSGNTVRELVSSSETSLSVEFRFRAEDKDWTVVRVARSTGSGGLHKLTCDDDPLQKFDNSSAVNAKVKELVGLEREGFLRAVVLPQGRFQQLLQATPGERNGVLKGIFRVDELELVREVAETAKGRVAASLGVRVAERAKLLDNPGLTAAETAEVIAETATIVDKLSAADTAYREASDLRTANLAQVQILRTLVTTLAANRRPDDAAAFAALAVRADILDAQIEAAEAKLNAAEASADDLDGTLKQFDAAGLGSEGLARARSALDRARDDLPHLRAERDRLDLEGARLEAEAASLESRLSDVDAALAAARAAASSLMDAETFERAERAALAAGQDALREYRRVALEHANLESERDQLAARTETLDAEVTAANESFAVASEALRVADEQLQAARRLDHAAAAAAGVSAGDPCPVCARVLPDGFVAPHSHQEAAATAAQAAAAQAERAAHSAAENTRARRVARTEEESRLASRLVEAGNRLARAVASVKAAVPGANLAGTDDEILLPLTERVSAALASLEALRAERDQLGNAATSAEAAYGADFGSHTRAKAGLDGDRERLKIRRRQYEDSLVSLPEPVRPTNTVGAAALEAASAVVVEMDRGVREAQVQLEAARQEARTLRRDVDQLRSARAGEIAAPVSELRLKQATLGNELIRAATHLELPYQQPLVRTVFSLETASAEAAAADIQAGQFLAAAERASARSEAESEAAESRMSSALASVSCATLQDLDHARIEARARLSNAEQLHVEAVRQQPIAAALDTRIRDGNELVESLEIIRSHFTDSKFLGYVLKSRQKILLAVGSEVLASMTNGRYGFAEDFRIIDSWSGQPRDVMTLSGGETFLASLALALGLVELAGRSGGKLDALFLDEGFGSLDANTLPDALRALEAQATGGRFVAVISHLRAVAESFDNVLHVTRTPEGSKADWLTPQERETVLGSDAESGLLS